MLPSCVPLYLAQLGTATARRAPAKTSMHSSPKPHRLIIHLEQHQREWLVSQSKYTPMAAVIRRLIDDAIRAEDLAAQEEPAVCSPI